MTAILKAVYHADFCRKIPFIDSWFFPALHGIYFEYIDVCVLFYVYQILPIISEESKNSPKSSLHNSLSENSLQNSLPLLCSKNTTLFHFLWTLLWMLSRVLCFCHLCVPVTCSLPHHIFSLAWRGLDRKRKVSSKIRAKKQIWTTKGGINQGLRVELLNEWLCSIS